MGISMWEVFLILVVALIILGPKQLVEAARSAGKIYREIQKVAWDVKNTISLETLTESDTGVKESKKASSSEISNEKEEAVEHEQTGGADFYADLLEAGKEKSEDSKAGTAEVSSDDSEARAEKTGKETKPEEGLK